MLVIHQVEVKAVDLPLVVPCPLDEAEYEALPALERTIEARTSTRRSPSGNSFASACTAHSKRAGR